jgi:ribosome biogenesis GTPase
VLLRRNDSGISRITELLPRRSKFSRADFSGHGYAHIKANREQIVAVNFDYVFIVTSLNKDFNIKRVERYLIQVRQSGGKPVVILTKSDLAGDIEEQLEALRNAAPGVPVHAVSSFTGQGLEALDAYLKPGKTVVFLGMSGVGKSSLLNALMGREVMIVKAIREDDSRGRHTTTHRQLFMLPSGAMVIDTPGMRELGLFGSEDAITEGFSDIEELIPLCRFTDCHHENEPGCAVRAALSDGSLSPGRWENYLSQVRESSFAEDKSAFLREKRERNKNISMFSRDMKKKGRVRR